MLKTELGEGFFTIHQIVGALMSGLFLGIVLKAMLMMVRPDAWLPNYHPALVSSLLGVFLFCGAYMVVVGHVILLRDKAKLKRAYKQVPSSRRIKLAKLSFWPIFALGALMGYSAKNELFFLPI